MRRNTHNLINKERESIRTDYASTPTIDRAMFRSMRRVPSADCIQSRERLSAGKKVIFEPAMLVQWTDEISLRRKILLTVSSQGIRRSQKCTPSQLKRAHSQMIVVDDWQVEPFGILVPSFIVNSKRPSKSTKITSPRRNCSILFVLWKWITLKHWICVIDVATNHHEAIVCSDASSAESLIEAKTFFKPIFTTDIAIIAGIRSSIVGLGAIVLWWWKLWLRRSHGWERLRTPTTACGGQFVPWLRGTTRSQGLQWGWNGLWWRVRC